MASPGGRSRGGTCVWRVSSRWEHTWARLGAPSAPKSILTPLKRLSASMALQCNYPVGNDISTQFLPASLLPGSDQLPQASRWRLVDHAGLRTVVIWSLRAERWRCSGPQWWESSCYLISEAVQSLSLSQIECDVAQLAVKITDFSAVTEEDILWKLQVLMISDDNLEDCSREHMIGSQIWGDNTEIPWVLWGKRLKWAPLSSCGCLQPINTSRVKLKQT